MEATIAGASQLTYLVDETDVGHAGPQAPPCEDRTTGAGESFFRRGAYQGGLAERNAMIDRTHALPVVRQCQLLGLSRSTTSYQPTLVSATALALMRRIDERHLAVRLLAHGCCGTC
jgi:hypothetical protein